MGWLGGPLGDYLLRGFAPSEASSLHPGDPHSGLRPADTLAARFGPDFPGAVAARTVIDFGSGTGADAVEIARLGAARVIGVEIRAELRAQAAERAERAGCGDRCIFVERPAEPTDVVISNDAFEHFDDPAGVLRDMAGLIGPDGKVFVAFGPPWLHPRGGHLFSAFPWAHLIFTEACLIRWRARFRKDGARRFAEVPGGLNQMTVARFERLVAQSPLRIARLETIPIRGLRLLTLWPLREFGTSRVRALLVPR